MVMYVSYTDNRRYDTAHVGKPISMADKDIYELVAYVEANGDELTHILTRFVDIPMPASNMGKRSILWFGDHAKFIVANW